MKALVFAGPGKKELREVDKPRVVKDSDAVVRLVKTTICGTDLHILGGDVPAVKEGTILGHEGIGIVEEVGAGVSNFKVGDKVIISCVTSCGKCHYCKKSLYAHCEDGGWILGHLINGTQAEYVHIPHADNSLYHIPQGISDDAAVMISDILPTGLEIGVLNGQVSPGDVVAIVGAGPIGMSALLTSQFYSPSKIIMIDLDDNRLQESKKFGATETINSRDAQAAIDKIFEMTDGRGVDVAIEAVGYPATFDICQRILSPGGRLANVGVHGKPVDLQLQDLWIRNVTISTGLVSTSTTPMLIKTLETGKIKPERLATHRYKFDDMMEAYETFANAADEHALKIIIDFQ
ncbi:zinc-dependent alcohol dehydrogenase family protein [Lysinibacillus mangiferihumi]|uniref:Zinc-dependent alcohol dehydrogenase family protein n=1 Tax=Lysinibacillus mangiferihumi TaxID=1130819 RepID=A0A4U2Z2T2_9BACI|nr:zinc-dependent alcohol dehydrogenase family protein [Lysinibacillus mangiferihumi]TKI68014.1 zinc-dependent alcohol dehydrogenase family protein [Lysinibacillus mangiferihumi]